MKNEQQPVQTTAPTSEAGSDTAPVPEQLPELRQSLSDPEIAWRLDERRAQVLGKASAAVPKAFAGKPADIMACWLMADELGISRMAMLRGAFVINGKPQLSGDLLLAVARGAGVKVNEYMQQGETPEDAAAVCEVTLHNGDVVKQAFSVQDAINAKLWESSEPWKRYPQRMLQMRARGWALRDAIPERLAGVYAEGELIEHA